MQEGCDTVCGDAVEDMSNPAASRRVLRTIV
jgi:hypothetical protein